MNNPMYIHTYMSMMLLACWSCLRTAWCVVMCCNVLCCLLACHQNVHFYEVSAKTGENVGKAFEAIALATKDK
jgi:hypothetical protein